MRSLPPRVRLVLVCAGMVAIATALACTCTLPLSLRATPTETLPPVLIATQPAPTATSEPTATPTAAVTLSPTPTPAAPIVVLPTKTKLPPTITLTSAPPPGGGFWGIAKSDLELYGASQVSPIGATTTLTLDVRNYGPHDYEGPLSVVCVAQGFPRLDPSQFCPPAIANVTVQWLQGVGIGQFNVDLLMTNPACVYPAGQCSIIVPDDKDPNPANNQTGFALQ